MQSSQTQLVKQSPSWFLQAFHHPDTDQHDSRIPTRSAAREPSGSLTIKGTMNRFATRLNNHRTNAIITNTCIGTAVAVFGAWKLTEPGPVSNTIEQQRAWLASKGIPVPTRIPVQQLRQKLQKYFVLNSKEPKNYVSWIGSEFSHRNLYHIAFNLITWHSFSKMLSFLPPMHTAGIIFGSAVASSAAFLYDAKGKTKYGIGSSGIVSGVLMTCTMFAPMAQARIMGIIPAPLVLLTGGYFLMDTYLMQSGQATGIGHAAHLGGGVFGALYYALFLRRYGGILAR